MMQRYRITAHNVPESRIRRVHETGIDHRLNDPDTGGPQALEEGLRANEDDGPAALWTGFAEELIRRLLRTMKRGYASSAVRPTSRPRVLSSTSPTPPELVRDSVSGRGTRACGQVTAVRESA